MASYSYIRSDVYQIYWKEYCRVSLIDIIISIVLSSKQFYKYIFGHTNMCVNENLCLFPAMNRRNGDYTMVTLTDEYLRSEGN